MIEIKKGTLAERIIKNVQECYPITIKELNKKLGVSIRTLKAECTRKPAQIGDKDQIGLIRRYIIKNQV